MTRQHLVPRDPDNKLFKLVLLLSSDQPGEVQAAAKAIGRILESRGRSWHDLAATLAAEPELHRRSPSEDLRSIAHFLLTRPGWSGHERDFLLSMTRILRPSPKQTRWILSLYAVARGCA